MSELVIIDYGAGNPGSVVNMFRRIGVQAELTADPKRIREARRIVLPGVGSFDAAASRLHDSGLAAVLGEQALELKKPILGICVGAQLFFEQSAEGTLPGFGWIKGEVKKFEFAEGETKLPVPHMGWNQVFPKKSHPLFPEPADSQRFYFAHSYFLAPARSSDILASTEYGREFASVVAHQNILGVQFHPEKSHRFGMALLKRFSELP